MLSPAELALLDEHLDECPQCSHFADQLRATVSTLRLCAPRRRLPTFGGGEVPPGQRDALSAHLPHLYALANALDADGADDLVQDTLAAALADPDTEMTGAALSAALMRFASGHEPDMVAPAAPVWGTDPDADEPELFYSEFYADGPDAGAWIDPPIAWGEARVLLPDDDLLSTETFGVIDAALDGMDRTDADLVTLVDIEGAPLRQGALELDLPSAEAQVRLARARFTVRAALSRHLLS